MQTTMPTSHHSVFLQAGCPSWRPTNSVKALKAIRYSIYIIIESCLSLCVLSSPKQLNILWQNLACGRVSTLSYTWAGSYFDRGHRWEENENFIKLCLHLLWHCDWQAQLSEAVVERRLFCLRYNQPITSAVRYWLGAPTPPGRLMQADTTLGIFRLRVPVFGHDAVSWDVGWWVGRAHCSVIVECLVPMTGPPLLCCPLALPSSLLLLGY